MANLSELWLKSANLTADEKKQISSLSEEEKEAYFADKNLEFGTAGIRAEMGLGTRKLNRFTIAQAINGFAMYLKEAYMNKAISVVVGHDTRINGKEFSMIATKIFNKYGIKVYLFPRNMAIPTPVVSYAVRALNCQGGLNITASHNPKQYNGLKMYTYDGAQITVQDKQIGANMCQPADVINLEIPTEANGIEYIKHSFIKQYFAEAKNTEIDHTAVQRAEKNFKIVLNPNQGTASRLLKKYLKFLGYKAYVQPKMKRQDPLFRACANMNPEYPISFEKTFVYADKIGSQICLAVDPDADRLAVAVKHDGKWVILNGNETGVIIANYILKNKTFTFKLPYIVTTFVSTSLIDRIAKQYNASVYRTPTGFKWIGSAVTQIEQASSLVIAFEESIGSLVNPINRDKDSFTAATILLEIVCKYREVKMDLVDVLNEIYARYGYNCARTVSYDIKGLQWKDVVAKKMVFFKAYPRGLRIGSSYVLNMIAEDKQNGIIEWQLSQDSWIKFRASGTEPKLKAYICLYANSKKEVNEKFDEVKAVIDYFIENEKNIPLVSGNVKTEPNIVKTKPIVEPTKEVKQELVVEKAPYIEPSHKDPLVKRVIKTIEKEEKVIVKKIEDVVKKTVFKSKKDFNPLVMPTEKIMPVLGSDDKITRPQAVKKVWAYIKAQKLQDKVNKKNIHIDEKLALFIPDKQVISMFELTKYINDQLLADAIITTKNDEVVAIQKDETKK